jgi:hypothetical protein
MVGLVYKLRGRSAAMEELEGASDGDAQDEAWGRSSRHTDQHAQLGIHVEGNRKRFAGYNALGRMYTITKAHLRH